MASFNKVILLGNLTRDPEVRYTTGGAAVAELGLAVNRKWFDKQTNQTKEEVCFVDCTAWGKTAENCAQFLAKGRQCLVEGRLSLDQWEDKQTGAKRSKLKVIAETVTFVGGAKSEGGGKPDESRPAEQPSGDFDNAAGWVGGHQPDDGDTVPF